ncbi:hypothetical protein ACJX0J_013191 [Zea mays]
MIMLMISWTSAQSLCVWANLGGNLVTFPWCLWLTCVAHVRTSKFLLLYLTCTFFYNFIFGTSFIYNKIFRNPHLQSLYTLGSMWEYDTSGVFDRRKPILEE